jgi:hypothetical protein
MPPQHPSERSRERPRPGNPVIRPGRPVGVAPRLSSYLPREVPHAFRTTGTVPVRFLALTLPGGLLDIHDEAGVPAAERRLPDAGVSDADIARWLELAPRYGLRVVGPPIPEAEA